MSIIIETERMIIREFSADELDTYLHHFSDDRVTEHLPDRSREERVKIFTDASNYYEVSKTAGIWGMFDKRTGQFIGSCLLRPFEDEKGILELGYSLDHDHWGKGLATEMAKAVIAYGMADDDVNEIVAVTTLANTASQNVILKAGLKRVNDITRGDEPLAFFRMKGTSG